MKNKHGHAITFPLVPGKGLDGEKIDLSRYAITGPYAEYAELIQRSFQLERKDDALHDAPMLGERLPSSQTAYRAHPNYRLSWSGS
jgi:hypothetical protein